MARYTILMLWSFIITPTQAQIERCDILHLTDAVVISEYLPCPRIDLYYVEGAYVEGCHYIYYNSRTIPFKIYSNYNKTIVDRYESNVYIPECLHTTKGDPVLDWLSFDYSYDLTHSEHERHSPWIRGRIESNDFYKRTGKKKLYVAYAFNGDIVIYKMRRKILFQEGFKDPIYELKPKKSSKFAVLKKAEKLRSLTTEEAKMFHLKKVEKSYIHVFYPE